ARRVAAHTGAVASLAFAGDGAILASGGADGTVRLTEVASGRALATMRGHKGAVGALAFSSDGAEIATGGADGRVILWARAGGTQIAAFDAPGGRIVAVGFDAAGGVARPTSPRAHPPL